MRRQRGIALILSMLVLSILLVLVTQFAWTAKVEKTIARNSKDDMKMLFAARGTLALAKAYLRADREKGGPADSLREDWADPEKVKTLQIGQTESAGGGVAVQAKLEDCERFLNVNLFCDATTKAFAKGVLLRLAGRLEIERGDEVVAAIEDYLDDDKEGEHEQGARNGPVTHAGEILAIVDQAGGDAQQVFEEALVGKPQDPQSADVPAKRGLLEFLTAYGKKTLNINTVEADPLMWAVLPEQNAQGQAVDRDAAIAKFVEYRTGAAAGEEGTGTTTPPPTSATGAEGAAAEKPGKDFLKVEDLNQVEGMAGIIAQQQQDPPSGGKPPKPLRALLGVDALDFRLDIVAERAGLKKHYEAVLRRGVDQFDVLEWREVGR